MPTRTVFLGSCSLASSILLAGCGPSGPASEDRGAPRGGAEVAVPVADPPCTPPAPAEPVPAMTVKVYNDSATHYLYPVIESGPGATDTWMQAWYRLPQAELARYPFVRTKIHRIFVNPTTGIAPNGAVAITLPLFTRLASGCIDPQADDQFIDWWQGGRLSLFASTSATPPPALVAEYEHAGPPIVGAADLPSCPACSALEVYASSDGVLPNAAPIQVSEWTLGANIVNSDPAPAPHYLLDTSNVDFDVSYVNNAYLPLAMEAFIPEDDPEYLDYPGYIGTINSIDGVSRAIDAFLHDYSGWPQYTQGTAPNGKVPSPLEIFAVMQNLDPACGSGCDTFLPSGSFTALPGGGKGPVGPDGLWAPIGALARQWQDCTVGGGRAPICDDIRELHAMFEQNYKTYSDQYISSKVCDPKVSPVPLNLSTMLAHVYGWTQLNAGCPADWNLLYGSPKNPDGSFKYPDLPKIDPKVYQARKAIFDELNLSHPEFNPYVQLIHGKEYMNAQSAYAFSVDDALGNMQTHGKGVILVVGDATRGFPNPKPAKLPVSLSYGFGSTDAVRFVTYSVCSESRPVADDPNYHAVTLWADPLAACPVWFRDNRGNAYTLTITEPPPYPAALTCALPGSAASCTSDGKQYIDCSKNPAGSVGRQWCEQPGGITVQTLTDAEGHPSHEVVAGAPPQPPP